MECLITLSNAYWGYSDAVYRLGAGVFICPYAARDPARLIAGPEADAQVIELVRSSWGWISRCITSSGTISAMRAGGFWPVDGVASSGCR